MEGKKAYLFWFIVGFIVAGVVAIVSAQMVEVTAEPKFCGSCHEMKPMYETWMKGPHGPDYEKGRGVARAKCADCHLPHTSVIAYLFNKAKFGAKDFITHFVNPAGVDWIEKRKERKHYVFISNCYRCHENLTDAPGMKPAAKMMHKMLLSGKLKGKDCLDCHFYVGHGMDFEQELKEAFGEK